MIKKYILFIIFLLPLSSSGISPTEFSNRMSSYDNILSEVEKVTGLSYSATDEKYRSALSVEQVKEFFDYVADKSESCDSVSLNAQQMIIFGYINNIFNIPYSIVQYRCGLNFWKIVEQHNIFSAEVLQLICLWYQNNKEYCLDANRLDTYRFFVGYSDFYYQAHRKLDELYNDKIIDWYLWSELKGDAGCFDFSSEICAMLIEYNKERYSSYTKNLPYEYYSRSKFTQ